MSLELANCVIHHIPKHAGLWVEAVLNDNGVEFVRRYDGVVTDFLREIIIPGTLERHHFPVETDKPALMITRDFDEWYKSYFAFREYHERQKTPIRRWDNRRRFDRVCRRATFGEFFQAARDEYSMAFYTKLTAEYREFSTKEIDFYRLISGLSEFIFEHEGVKLLRFPPPRNTRPKGLEIFSKTK